MFANGSPTTSRRSDQHPAGDYTEGLETGHRWYDAQNIQPLFPFGYGLSYTTFTADHLQVTPATVQDTKPIRVRFSRLTNTGRRASAQVEQVYLTLPASSGEPPKRLVGWARVTLDPGQSRNVEVVIDPASADHPLSYYDSGSQRWVTPSGTFTVSLGSSVDNIDQTDTIRVHSLGFREQRHLASVLGGGSSGRPPPRTTVRSPGAPMNIPNGRG